jgi:hypothetical protein
MFGGIASTFEAISLDQIGINIFLDHPIAFYIPQFIERPPAATKKSGLSNLWHNEG